MGDYVVNVRTLYEDPTSVHISGLQKLLYQWHLTVFLIVLAFLIRLRTKVTSTVKLHPGPLQI